MAQRDEMDSAMGPDEEPGEAQPARAAEATGLGGAGTEGKPGAPEGGTEPQIPPMPGTPSAENPDQRFATLLSQAKERLRAEDAAMDQVRESGVPHQDPPLEGKSTQRPGEGATPEAGRARAPGSLPRTGVGTPGPEAEPAGADLGEADLGLLKNQQSTASMTGEEGDSSATGKPGRD